MIARVIDDIVDIINRQLSDKDEIKAKYEYIKAVKKEKKKIKEKTNLKLQSRLT